MGPGPPELLVSECVGHGLAELCETMGRYRGCTWSENTKGEIGGTWSGGRVGLLRGT